MNLEDPRVFSLFLDLYGELPRAAPGSDDATRKALNFIPNERRQTVLDIGCGPGAQTLSLANALPEATITAFDMLPSMATETRRRCNAGGFGDRVLTLVADMAAPPVPPASQDLIWCEGAIYALGVERALRRWRNLLTERAFVVFSEPVWLQSNVPEEIRRWWFGEYPALTNVQGIEAAVVSAGFQLLASFPLPPGAWLDDYYEPLEARIADFDRRYPGDKDAAAVSAAAAREVSMFRRYGETYGYQFFVTRPGSS